MRRRWSIPLTTLVLVIASVAAAASATARSSGHHPGIGDAAQSGHVPQPGGPVANIIRPHAAGTGPISHATSTNWSGYAATGGTYTSVSASWTEPSVSCSSGNQYSSFWVGLDGDGSNSVEQTGSEADCSGSTPQYYSWYEMYPSAPVNFSGPVSPGDQFTGSVTYNGGSSFTLKLSDTTKGWSQTVNASLSGASRASAEVIVEAPSSNSGVLPLANFGTMSFSGSTVDGSTLSSLNPTEITMVSSNGTQEDSISALNGGSYSATWDSSG
jgi:Peptidase A4 family